MIRKYRVKALKIWREWIRPILVILIVCGSFRSAVADWNDVPTGSMRPTIVEGDRIFVNKIAYGLRFPFTSWRLIDFSEPQRGDIVVFFSPDDGIRMVKRVIGLPGDTIELRKNRIFINSGPATYSAFSRAPAAGLDDSGSAAHRVGQETINGQAHPVMVMRDRRSRQYFGPFTVPHDQYFLMGDNRDNSRDSRWFGAVSRDLIVGRTSSVVFSLDADNHFLPRVDRFFHSLP